MQKALSKLVPDFLKPPLKKIYFFVVDTLDTIKGRDDMTPPQGMIFIGSGDFKQIGEEFKRYLIELLDLKPDDRVLDVGCGIGRMAIPLTNYLSKNGGYWGFDIVKDGIVWSEHHISPKFPNFHFLHSDIHNKNYNPQGKTEASHYRFSYENEFFDVVFLTSVFTHMLPADIENYLREISRVIKPGGRCLITFFLLNDESLSQMRSGASTMDFKYELQGFFTTDKTNPEAAIAYEEQRIRKWFEAAGLQIVEPVRYGSWCQRSNFLTFQDVIIAAKPS